jgi:hypothetical protein
VSKDDADYDAMIYDKRFEVCWQPSPPSVTPLRCTLRAGHDGPHKAQSSDAFTLRSWP